MRRQQCKQGDFMKVFSILFILLFTAGIFGPDLFVKPAFGQDNEKVQELQQLIEAQQKQLEMQQQQIDAQRQLLLDLQTQIESLADEKETTAQKPALAEEKKTVQAPVEKVVTSRRRQRHRCLLC
jgi:Na+-transporting NADH:ubiquinone oxidoreductase subunit NqrC